MSGAAIKRVISVCEAKDLLVWKIASASIVRHIDAGSYQLVCPDAQVDVFRAATHPRWEIAGESLFTADCTLEMVRAQVRGENLGRVNWLFQQFAKINAITHSGLADDDVALIWDADTVPLRRLDFVDRATGRLRFYHSRENHEPYFRTIGLLLGSGKRADVSFIAQCFPVRAGWVRGMIAEIESCSGKPYVEAVLDSLPGKSGAEFSEYETIGTWLMRNHCGEIELRKHNYWLRGGSSLLPSDPSVLKARIMLSILAAFFDYVAIENWKSQSLWRRVSRKLLKRGG